MLLFTLRNLKLQLTVAFISTFGLCNAQVQISDFPNDTLNDSNDFELKFSTAKLAYFTMFTPETGRELWVTDGSKEGTSILKDFELGTGYKPFDFFAETAGKVIFSNGGDEVWLYDEERGKLASISWYSETSKAIVSAFDARGKLYFICTDFSSYFIYEVNFEKLIASQIDGEILSYCIDKDEGLVFSKKNRNEGYDYFNFNNSQKALFNLPEHYNSISIVNGENERFIVVRKDEIYPIVAQDLRIIYFKAGAYEIENIGGTCNAIPNYFTDSLGNDFFLTIESQEGTEAYLVKLTFKLHQFINGKMELLSTINSDEIHRHFLSSNRGFITNVIYQKGKIFFSRGYQENMYSFPVFFNMLNLENSSFELFEITNLGTSGFTASIIKSESDELLIRTQAEDIFYNPFTREVEVQTKNVRNPSPRESSINLWERDLRFSHDLKSVVKSDTTVVIEKSNLFYINNYSQYSMLWKDSCLFVLRGDFKENKVNLYQFVNDKLVNELTFEGGYGKIETIDGVLDYVFVSTNLGVSSVNVSSFQKEYLGDLNGVYSRYKRFNLNKQLAFYDRKKLILSNGEETSYLDLDSTKTYNFYEKNNRIYAITPTGYLGTISVLEDNKFILIDTNVVIDEAQKHFGNNKIYYTKEGQNGRKSIMSHSIEGGLENYGFNDGSNLIGPGLIDLYQENDLVVYNFEKDKLLWRSNNAEQRFYKSVVDFDEKLVLYNPFNNAFYLSSDGLKRIFQLDISHKYFNFIKTTEGFYLKSKVYRNNEILSSLMYFDAQTEDTTMIFSDTSVQFNARLVDGTELLLIEQFQNDSIPYNVFVWLPETKKLEIIENSLESDNSRLDERFKFEKCVVTTNENELRIYDFSNSSKPEPFIFYHNNFDIYNFSLINIGEGTSAYCYTTYSPKKGRELALLTKNKVIMFDESTKGPVGLQLNYDGIVNSNDAIYVYNFTYKNGWQVLKYDFKIETKYPLALKEQDGRNSELVVFPNPFINLVNISGEKFDSFEVLNSTGQSVKKGLIFNNKIDLEELTHGIYLLKLNASDKVRVIRILK